MGSLSFNQNKKNKKGKNGAKLHKVAAKKPSASSNLGLNNKMQNHYAPQNPQIISGYFTDEKSYKEIAIARVNTFLCCVLGFLVAVCLVSYYFVTMGDVTLNQIGKQTLALNYENDELQNKLDNMQAYYNIDKAVQKSNMLQRATKVMELPAANIQNVKFENKEIATKNAWSMGY